MTARIFFHVQHLLGSGHLRRAAAIASALARHGFIVELLSGGMPVNDLDCGGARLIQLPPARAADATFRTLLDGDGRPIDDSWREARRGIILSRFERFQPDVLITELFPLGRRSLSFELVPLLETARRSGKKPLTLASVRDVLTARPDPHKLDEMVDRVQRWYDHVLVHGDPALLPLAASFPEHRIADRIAYTGYVAAGPPPAPLSGDGEGEVIVSAGGGAVGAMLLRTALEARPFSAVHDRTWRLLLGTGLPAKERDTLMDSAAPGCIVEPARPDFPGLLARCHVSVSQAGYNTVMDILAARARAVLVPFAAENETEQTVRASTLAARGMAITVNEASLTPDRLAAAIDDAARLPRPRSRTIRCDGAEETARMIGAWLAARSVTA